MPHELQEGIYFSQQNQVGNSFCLLSLRIDDKTDASEAGRGLGKIWAMLGNLKKGIINDLNIDPRHRKDGNLTVLLGYGLDTFSLKGIRRRVLSNFNGEWNFMNPRLSGGGPLLKGSGISYSNECKENPMLKDHVIFQLIADSEFYTHRAIVEVWKLLHASSKNGERIPFYVSGIYRGFQRDDKRNWLGFHDGVSNMTRPERIHAIAINPSQIPPEDRWVANGTYLAFLKIGINLARWEDTSVQDQEILIGREKLSGCPLIGVDKNNKPIKDSRCPVVGTTEVIDPGNEGFRDHPPYGVRPNTGLVSDKILIHSHIGSTRAIDQIPVGDRKSFRIFRQGFEFLDFDIGNPSIVTGLNFVSFQSTPERFFKSLTYLLAQKNLNLITVQPKLHLDDFMFVLAGGLFLVPPVRPRELFPGQSIFFDSQ